ncbi:MAG TPA: tetratricopeptide repeat protein [Gemmataceae bacterium]|nr:tetratricopeptide repeat protein [Gemmataceae bacterium]
MARVQSVQAFFVMGRGLEMLSFMWRTPCLCIGGLLLAWAHPCVAAAPTLAEARQRWLHGNYAEARALYETLAKEALGRDPKGSSYSAAVIGLSRALQSQGEYDKALQSVDAALQSNPADADLHARRAELLYLRGRWEDAEKAAEKALAGKPEHFLARWVRAQVYSDRADLKQADTELRWFIRTYSERSNKDDDIKNPDELLLVGLAGADYARWHSHSDQFTVILNDVYGDAHKNEKAFWLADYEAGMLLLEKYNRGEALDAFDKALTTNPNAAEALVGKGLAALQRLEVQAAQQFADRALRINPNLPEGLRLRANAHVVAGDLKEAVKDLEQARKINPRDENTLGEVAACFLLQREQNQFDALAKEVTARDPKPCIFYHVLAERLEDRHHYELAEKYYKVAREFRPKIPWPNNSLGMLYMRLGREKEAREVLEKAFQADEFNVRVSNTLKVLHHLDKYETLKTEHFLLRFDRQSDGRLARYMANYLEEIYADLAVRFNYRPAGPILVEVFNNHEMFSGRTVALPDLHTIGACTGRVFAMVSPNGKGLGKPFNWARVLRHEMVHIFNLEETNFQCPHWFTEGLAVNNEGFPRPQQWNQLLRQRVPSGDLLNLDNIEFAFIRPRSQLEWTMAYCQSQLYIDFLQEQYGPKVVGQFLDAYREGMDTKTALSKVCHVDKEAFEKAYRDYLADVVKKIQGRPIEKTMTYNQLQQAYEAKPDDLDLAARLAEQYFIRHENKDARALVEKVLAKKSKHALACYVKARLLIAAGDEEEARKLLETALDRLDPDPKVLQALGKLYYELRDYGKAADIYELAHRVEPYESKWLVDLARVYTLSGNQAKRIDALLKLAPTDADDLAGRKQLAQLLLDAGRHVEAEQMARQALEIDVRDAEAQDALFKALEAQKKTAELEKMRKLLGE